MYLTHTQPSETHDKGSKGPKIFTQYVQALKLTASKQGVMVPTINEHCTLVYLSLRGRAGQNKSEKVVLKGFLLQMAEGILDVTIRDNCSRLTPKEA